MVRIVFILSLFLVLMQPEFATSQEKPKQVEQELEYNQKAPIEVRLVSVKVLAPCGERKLLLKAEVVNKSSEKVVINKNALWYRISIGGPQMGSASVHDLIASSEKVVTDKNASQYRISVEVAQMSSISVQDFIAKEYMVLSPGEKYESEYKHTLRFSRHIPGKYDVSVAYGQFYSDEVYEGIKVWKGVVESNKVTFRLVRCKSKQGQSR